MVPAAARALPVKPKKSPPSQHTTGRDKGDCHVSEGHDDQGLAQLQRAANPQAKVYAVSAFDPLRSQHGAVKGERRPCTLTTSRPTLLLEPRDSLLPKPNVKV